MNSIFSRRDNSRRGAIKSIHQSSNKIHDISNVNCYICNDKKFELSCVICKKNTCLNCSNNDFCLYCNMKEENKHLIETYIKSTKQENRVGENVEDKEEKYNKKKYIFCCF